MLMQVQRKCTENVKHHIDMYWYQQFIYLGSSMNSAVKEKLKNEQKASRPADLKCLADSSLGKTHVPFRHQVSQ